MRIFTFLMISIFGCLICDGQDFDNFERIQSEGEIPTEFLTLSSFKVERQKQSEIEANTSRKDRKSKEEFLLQSNFLIDNLLASGKVMFNDPVTNYVRRVSDYILRDMPELKSEIRVYTVKSSAVNAFATNDGIVFVTLGLISRLENEAQLAFILCHEYQHFIHKHPISKYIETKRIKTDQGLLKRLSFDEQMLLKNQFSKEQEVEADEKGFALFQNTIYDYGAINGVFDVLMGSGMPLGNRKFDHKFLETESLKFPEHVLIFEEDTNKLNEDYDDENSTHPSIGKRRRLIAERIKDLDNSDRRGFLFTPKEFLEIRKSARFELAGIYLDQLRFEEALYSSWLMLQVEPNSRYLKKIALRSLYGISKYSNVYKLNEIHWNPSDARGNFRKIPAMVDNLYRFEFNGLALRMAVKLQKEYPEDSEIRQIVTDLLDELAMNHPDFLRQISEEPRPEKIDSVDASDDLSEEKNSFMRWGFSDVMGQSGLATEINERQGEDWKTDRNANSLQAMEMPRNKRKGFKLGIDKIVIVDPIFQKVDQRKNIPVAYMDGESGLQKMKMTMRESASALGLSLEMLETDQLQKNEVTKFNDMGLMKNWISNRMKTMDLEYFVPPDQTTVKALLDRYGTPYFGVSGLLALTESKSSSQKYYLLLLGCMTVYGLPIALVSAFTPIKSTYFLTLVFNIETGEIMMASADKLKAMPRNDYMNSKIYDTMYQIKRSK